MSLFTKCILFCVPILIVSAQAQMGGWQLQDSGTDLGLNDVFFVDANTGWVVGQNVILNTIDGGKTWTVQDSSSCDFWAVYFTDGAHGWAVGYKQTGYPGIIYNTTNGGDDWYLKDSCDYELNDVFFVDADTGYAVGGGRGHATILKTTNAGSIWTENLNMGYEWLYTVYFVDLQKGWAAGARGTILRTIDGGKNWHRQSLDIGYDNLLSIHFAHPDTGWVLGGGDNLFKSTDGGESWHVRENLTNFNYHCCFFIDTQTGWLGARDLGNSTEKIFYTSNGGATWQVQDSLASARFNSIFFIDDHTGWIAGWPGKILKTTTGGVVSSREISGFPRELPVKIELFQNYPNPFNPRTIINYELPITNYIELSIYNLLGKKIATLVSGKQKAGFHMVEWDASGMASGVYLYRLTAEGNDYRIAKTKKLVLLR